jgi:tetrahydromethanopterin S-methyltransferase subunit C
VGDTLGLVVGAVVGAVVGLMVGEVVGVAMPYRALILSITNTPLKPSGYTRELPSSG